MDFLFFALFFLFILIPLVLGIIIPIYIIHHKATGSVINYDATKRKFVYKVNLTRNDIINRLKTQNDLDELACSFEFERSVVNFSEYGSNREYYFHIQEYSGFSIIRLEQVALIGMQSQIPLKLNPFLVRKLNAQIVPFEEYRF